MNKEIFVVFSEYPLGSNRLSEKLRMALGLTLNDDNKVHLVFLGKARHALAELDEAMAGMSPVNKHVLMLAKMKAAFYMETGGNFQVFREINARSITPGEVDALLDSGNVVIH